METHIINAQKNIALIAHDNRKKDLVGWVTRNKKMLSHHFLCGTGTTAVRDSEETGLSAKAYRSCSPSREEKIGALIAKLEIDSPILYHDPLESQPHHPDAKAVLRSAVLYNIPVSMNMATADYLMSSLLMERDYKRSMMAEVAKLR